MGKEPIDNDLYDDDTGEPVSEEKKDGLSEETRENGEINDDKSFPSEQEDPDYDSFTEDETPLLSDSFEESEEEKLRKKKVAKRAVIISACSVFVVAVCVFAFVFINQYTNKFIMTIDGNKISVEEFKLFYYTSDDADKDTVLASLTEWIIMEKMIKERDISMTAEEREEVASGVAEFKEYFASLGYDMPSISDERLVDILGMSTLSTKLYELTTADYTVDNSDFDVQYEDYVTNYKSYYIDAEYQYIMTETIESAQGAKEMIESGADINEVMAQYSAGYTEESVIEVIGIYEVSYYFGEEVAEEVLAMSVGQVSEAVEFSGMYVVFIMDHISIPTEDELIESFTEMYTDNKKYDMFMTELETLQNEANIKVNQKLLDTFA